jgi:hypothetical protein
MTTNPDKLGEVFDASRHCGTHARAPMPIATAACSRNSQRVIRPDARCSARRRMRSRSAPAAIIGHFALPARSPILTARSV